MDPRQMKLATLGMPIIKRSKIPEESSKSGQGWQRGGGEGGGACFGSQWFSVLLKSVAFSSVDFNFSPASPLL